MSKDKKSSGGKKFSIIDLSAYLALVIAAVLFLTSAILSIFENNAIISKVETALNLIKDIALFIAIASGGYSFAKNRTKLIRILYWIALVVYIACVFFGLGRLVF